MTLRQSRSTNTLSRQAPFGRYARDIIALGDSLKNEAVSANPMSVLGTHHAVDEVKALMATRVAQDEIELEMKSAILLGHEPMISAASREDVDLDRPIFGRRHADRSLGFDEKFSAQGRVRQ